MKGSWNEIVRYVAPGSAFKYWSLRDGSGKTQFTVERIDEQALHIKIPNGNPVRINRADFEAVYDRYDAYIAGAALRSEIRDFSRRSAYVIALIHAFREKEVPQTLGNLLTSRSKLFLKPEFGLISKDWPGVSFTHKAYAEQLCSRMNVERDFVVFSGTTNKEIVRGEWKGRLLCLAKIAATGTLDSRIVIPIDELEQFQKGNDRKFAWSIQVTEAWFFVDTPKAHDSIPLSYRELRRHRGSFVQILDTEIDGLLELRIDSIPLTPIELSDIANEDLSDPLTLALSSSLAGMRNRTAQGGKLQNRMAPSRKTLLSLRDLREMWKLNNGRCSLCEMPIPLETKNPLLKLSVDRILSNNIEYSVTNAQLTHRGCNLGKNAASTNQFDEWLSVLRHRCST